MSLADFYCGASAAKSSCSFPIRPVSSTAPVVHIPPIPVHHCAGCPFVDFHCGASMVKSSVPFPDSSGSRHRHRPCIPHLFLSFPGQDVPSRTSTVDANAVKRSRGFVESEQDTGCYSLIPKSSISEQNRENESSQKILWIRRF